MYNRKCTLIAFVLILALLLTACSGGLNGTYVSQGLVSQTFTFSGDTVTMSAFGLNASGTYRIDGDQIVISYNMFGQDYSWAQPFSRSGNTITIGGTEFKKQ